MPTYEERQNLESIAARLRSAVPDADLLVVDDNSPDGTGDLADKLSEADPHIQVLHRTDKAGLGPAYIAGFRWALERGYDAVVEMDADGSHQPEQLPQLLAALAGADGVIGSRWIPGGKLLNWPKSREVLSRAANVYVRIMLGLKIKDATGGYRAYRASALRAISLDTVESAGYCFQIDLTLRMVQAGLRIVEVPITFVERERGASKMSQAIIGEAFLRVAQWAVSTRLRLAQTRLRPSRLSGQAPYWPPAPLIFRLSGALALAAVATGVALNRGAAPSSDHFESLGQHRFEIGDGTPLQQHVPVAARWLDLLRAG